MKTSERLDKLAELKSAATAVMCFDRFFRRHPAPAELEIADWPEDGLAAGGSQLDGVVEDDRLAIKFAFGAALRNGVGTAQARLCATPTKSQLFVVVNLIENYGVYVLLYGNFPGLAEPAQSMLPDDRRPRRLLQQLDETACIVAVDNNNSIALGWSREELVGQPAISFVHPADHERAFHGWLQMLAGDAPDPISVRYRTSSGDYRWFEIRNSPSSKEGFYDTELIDVHDETTTLHRLREVESQFDALTSSLPIGVLQFDLNSRVVMRNRWMEETFGDLERIMNAEWLHPNNRGSGIRALQSAIAEGRGHDMELRAITALGTEITCMCRLHPTHDGQNISGAIASIVDITESASTMERLALQAGRDELTDLPNRRALTEHLEGRSSDSMMVLFIDVDDFKSVNDAHGHDVGDALLAHVAQSLREVVRPNDLVARVGGDEFVVVCEGVSDRSSVDDITARVHTRLNRRDDGFPGAVHALRCSIGVAFSAETSRNGDAPELPTSDVLISNADMAMYEAKRAGGGRATIFEQALRTGLTARLTVDRDLGHAIESTQLELYLQPICDLQNRSATGAEAVIRWHHPQLGVLPPAEILEATHRARRVEELSAWTLDQACALATKMSAMGLGPISINTSARELASPNFAQMVLGTLQRHQLPVSQLILEVTETVIIDNADVMFTLSDLADAGISIALDDFGAGFSSLNHLRLVPAEIVKLDRSYVADLEDHRTAAIVRAIVDLAKALGQSVIAEGVESETQLTKLLELGVQRGQGILFGQPEPADAFFESLVRT